MIRKTDKELIYNEWLGFPISRVHFTVLHFQILQFNFIKKLQIVLRCLVL